MTVGPPGSRAAQQPAAGTTLGLGPLASVSPKGSESLAQESLLSCSSPGTRETGTLKIGSGTERGPTTLLPTATLPPHRSSRQPAPTALGFGATRGPADPGRSSRVTAKRSDTAVPLRAGAGPDVVFPGQRRRQQRRTRAGLHLPCVTHYLSLVSAAPRSRSPLPPQSSSLPCLLPRLPPATDTQPHRAQDSSRGPAGRTELVPVHRWSWGPGTLCLGSPEARPTGRQPSPRSSDPRHARDPGRLFALEFQPGHRPATWPW